MFLAGREGNGASGGQGRINCGAKVRLKRTKELHIKSYPSKDKITVSTAESEGTSHSAVWGSTRTSSRDTQLCLILKVEHVLTQPALLLSDPRQLTLVRLRAKCLQSRQFNPGQFLFVPRFFLHNDWFPAEDDRLNC